MLSANLLEIIIAAVMTAAYTFIFARAAGVSNHRASIPAMFALVIQVITGFLFQHFSAALSSLLVMAFLCAPVVTVALLGICFYWLDKKEFENRGAYLCVGAILMLIVLLTVLPLVYVAL